MTSLTRIGAVLAGTAAILAATNASADTIDLTTGYGVCAPTNGATVCSAKDSDGSTGSGTFPAFVGTPGGEDPTFFMYNTTTAPLEADNEVGNGTNMNKDVTLGDFAVTNFNGTDVFTFVLDINQVNTNPEWFLSVDHISIFMGFGSLSGYNGAANTLGGQSATWALPAADVISLNYNLAAGSGRGDMFLYIPVTVFSAYGTDAHLQLYSSFGNPLPNNDGFEEWSYLSCTDDKKKATELTCYDPPPPPPPVPEPGVLALLGLGLTGVSALRRRATK